MLVQLPSASYSYVKVTVGKSGEPRSAWLVLSLSASATVDTGLLFHGAAGTCRTTYRLAHGWRERVVRGPAAGDVDTGSKVGVRPTSSTAGWRR